MAETQECRRCGVVLPESTPGRFCPSCLIREGLGEALEGGSRGQGTENGSWESGDSESEARGGRQAADGSGQMEKGGGEEIQNRFGDYELLEEIGHGGMGLVWKARQVSLNRTVALKMIRAGPFAAKEFVHRFRMEASAAAVLQHPNIVAVHEVGVHQGQHFFSMDYIAGQNLAQLVRDGPLPARCAARYMQTMAKAVQHAHDSGILHRDLKPSNVIIDGHDEPRLTDFGLAKQLQGDSAVTLTGEVIGTPAYMPPEQASGNRGAVRAWSDIYALGAILYHLLTGRAPFAASTLEETIQQVLQRDPVAVRLLNPAVPRDLETICLKCLEKEPAKRYATAQMLAEELGRFLAGKPVLARPVGFAGKTWRWCRRNPGVASAAAIALFSLVTGLAGVTWQWRRAAAKELFAQQNVYASDIKLAQLALRDNNVKLAATLLEKHRPAEQAQTDLRDWEWRYLRQLCECGKSTLLQQYAKPIRTVAVSEDGQLLALRTDGGQAVLWDLTTRRPLQEVAGAESLALSAQGNRWAFGGRDAGGNPVVEVWDLPAGRNRRTLPRPSSARSLALSPDGTLLATFDPDGRIAVIDLAAKPVLTEAVPPPRRPVAGVVAFAPDGNWLAVGEDYGGLQILDWRTGIPRRMPTATDAGVSALAFSPGGELIAAGFGYQYAYLQLWDPRSGQDRGRLANHAQSVGALAFSPDGRRLAVTDEGQTIRIWRVADQTEWGSLRAYEGEPTALAFLPDGRTLVSGGDDGAVRLWDVTLPARVSSHTTLVISYGWPLPEHFAAEAISPLATNAVVASPTPAIQPRVVHRYGFSFTPDGRSFLMPDKDGLIDVWDVRLVRRTERRAELGSNHWDVALSPDGHRLAAGDITGNITIWDWPAGRAVTNLTIPFEWCGRVRFSRSGRFLLANTWFHDEKANWRIWRTDDWQAMPLPAFPGEDLLSADLSPDDHWLASGYTSGAVRLSRFDSGRCEAPFTGHGNGVILVLFSPDGRTLCSGDWDNAVRLWDVSARRELGPYPGLSGGYGAAFSSDGQRLLTGGFIAKDPVKLWDLATHRELLSLQAEGTCFFGLGFAPDGNTLIAATLEGFVHLWHAP